MLRGTRAVFEVHSFVEAHEPVFCIGSSLVSGLAVPADRLGIVLGHALTLFIKRTDNVIAVATDRECTPTRPVPHRLSAAFRMRSASGGASDLPAFPDQRADAR